MGAGGTIVSLGDICWVEIPPANGHEQAGRRPAIIFQDDAYSALPVVLIIPLTTGTWAHRRFPDTTLLIEPTSENGLQEPSYALVFQLRAVDRQRLRNRIGTLDK